MKPLVVDGKTICKIRCEKSKREVFYGSAFYVRTNPATDRIDGRKMIEYIRTRFEKPNALQGDGWLQGK